MISLAQSEVSRHFRGIGVEIICTVRKKLEAIGERQLLCMARALLSKSAVVVMDEATASIDHQTDIILQQTIRMEFATSTVFTIAHRLETVLDSDRIMVLDGGSVVEFDTPQALIQQGRGHFYDLAKEGGYLEQLKRNTKE